MTPKRSKLTKELRQARRESILAQQPIEVGLYQGGRLTGRVVAVNGVLRFEMEP